jgi:acetoin utilization protein AcuC
MTQIRSRGIRHSSQAETAIVMARPVFVSHPVFEQAGYMRLHPLAIGRVGPVIRVCRALGWLDEGNFREASPASPEDLAGFHDPHYLAALMRVSEIGTASAEDRGRYGLGTMENPVFPRLFERVAASVGGSVLAARLVSDGGVAFHPAGGTHHGRAGRASGFCYSNDPVFAMRELLGQGLRRIVYVDLDAHHGDGVEDAFAGHPRTLCISIHEAGRWPGSGMASTDRALNFAVPRGFGDGDFESLVAGSLLPAVRAFDPEAVVLTCGADCLAGDPLSSMQLSNTALWDAILRIVELVPRAVILGGGGYNPWTTVRYWVGLWGRLNGFAFPSRLPEAAAATLRSFSCDLVDDDDIDPAWFTTLADAPQPVAHEKV